MGDTHQAEARRREVSALDTGYSHCRPLLDHRVLLHLLATFRLSHTVALFLRSWQLAMDCDFCDQSYYLLVVQQVRLLERRSIT